MSESRIELLRTTPAFGGVQAASLQLLLDESRDVHLDADEIFFLQGDAGDSLYVLESGTAAVVRRRGEESIELGRLATGDCFGEMALIDFQPRSAAVVATTPCVAIEIPSRALRSLYRASIEQYAMVMMNLGREVSRRLRRADERLFQLRAPADSYSSMT